MRLRLPPIAPPSSLQREIASLALSMTKGEGIASLTLAMMEIPRQAIACHPFQ
ncbi:MAG: hypothetical protein ACPLPS_09980 [bacterium]